MNHYNIAKSIAKVLDEGEAQAYGEIVSEFSNAAFAVALAILGNREDARDIVQDAFLMAYEMLGDLRDRSKFACWLNRIVSGLSKNFLRARKRRTAAHNASVEKMVESAPDSAVHAEEAERDSIVYAHIQRCRSGIALSSL